MQIQLSLQPASECWGKNALISFANNTAFIHAYDPNFSQFNRTLIQTAARKLRTQGIHHAELGGEHWNVEYCIAFQQGFHNAKKDYHITYPSLEDTQQQRLTSRLHCSDFVKEIINSPSSVITPEVLAQKAAEFITEQARDAGHQSAVSFQIISQDAVQQQGYDGLWQVGKGSANLPAMLQLDFNPTGKSNAPVLACLVGKGITFDSGGYSLKPSHSMDSMRTDMGGAALLTGALGLAIAQGLNARVKLYLCCAENMVSSRAVKLGDIVHYRNGVTAEVLNTDAEGRLVLADGLIEADKQQPQFIIDCATLTGAAKVAVGNDYHSVLSMDDSLVQALFNAAKHAQEPFWRLPFEPFHRQQIQSSFADITNTASVSVAAGASTATAFLSYFVKNYQQNWLHIDCSATYCKSATSLWATGATGLGIQTLASLLINKQ